MRRHFLSMSEWLYEYRERRDGITIPTIWVAIVLSALLHILMLGRWLPQVRLPSLDEPLTGETSRSLVVQLAPPAQRAAPPPSPAQPPQPAPAQHSAPPAVAARPRPAPSPPVMALNKPAPDVPAPPPVPAPSPTPAPPAPTGDLSSYIEAQRRARMAAAPPSLFSPSAGRAPAPPVEDDAARGDRAIAANLGLNRAPSYGPDATKRGGGIFQIQRMGYSDAEFLFYGWNKDIRRNTTQMIEVRKGDNSDLRLAVVRKMIAIIREYETEDFLWESPRLGRNVMLSARQRDNAGLEDFMLMEFFRTTQVQR
jgi:hypothetical protein